MYETPSLGQTGLLPHQPPQYCVYRHQLMQFVWLEHVSMLNLTSHSLLAWLVFLLPDLMEPTNHRTIPTDTWNETACTQEIPCNCFLLHYFPQYFSVPFEANCVDVLLAVFRSVDAICSGTRRWRIVHVVVFPTEGTPFPHLPWNLKKEYKMRLLLSAAPSSLSASFLHRSHSSCVPEWSTRLISARLRVSCRVSPKALVAPLAQAAVRFQTAWADGCLPKPKCAPFFN